MIARIRNANSLSAFVLYLVLSLIFFARILPGHFFDYYLGRETDPSLYMWSIAWWPYVFQHQVHPFFTKLIWAPNGINLAWVTSMPLLGVLAAPLTMTLGPLATCNLIIVMLPPLASVSAFLLCRRLSGSFGAALLGGFLFGFSPFVLGQVLSHLNQLLIFPVPLAVYLVVRRAQEDLTRNRFVLLLTLTLAMQFLLVLEPFAVTAFMAGVTLLIGLRVASNETRGRILRLVPEIAAAYAFTALLMSPYIYFYFQPGFPTRPLWSSQLYSVDLLNFVVPTSANAIGNWSVLKNISATFTGDLYEQGACLGIPLFAICVLWSRRHRGELAPKILLGTILVSGLLALGPFLQVAGRPLLPMPWLVVEKVPLIKGAVPARLLMYAFLAAAVIFAMWFSDPLTGAREKALGTLATLLMLMPNPSAAFWASRAPLPAFFRDGSSPRLLSSNDIVLPLPFGQDGMSMMWQAESGMNFRLAAGLTGLQPMEIRRWPVVNVFFGSRDLPEPELQLKSFIANLGITAIVIDASDPRVPQWKDLLASLNLTPLQVSGVVLYRIPSDTVKSYLGVTALEMEQRAERARFQTLVAATDRFVVSGGAEDKLDLATLQAAGLFPAGWSFTPKRNGYHDIWTGPLEGKIAIGVGGTASGLKPILDTYGAGADKIYFPFPRQWPPDKDRQGFLHWLLQPAIWGATSGESIQLMLMEFDPPKLRQLDARLALESSGPSLSLATVPREASR